jgi:sRNA-binding protein
VGDAVRINLDGSEAGPVTDQEREFSREKLTQAKAQAKAARRAKVEPVAPKVPIKSSSRPVLVLKKRSTV